MIALSIRQPWAWLIVAGHKDIENRDWPTTFRGDCLIHASKSATRADVEQIRDSLIAEFGTDFGLPSFDDLPKGGLCGIVTITGCVTASSSQWFVGEHGFLLERPRPIPFQPYKGRLQFFNVPEYD
ncbi:ASCH domain-containing protein [Methyloversatilis sp.]|uniref:ASCH domain-containing protein n=1 Tax=Methyloversatilis sp. TaxID=2569862 RepID=UPI002737594B|nr:ASCH domain-containing protein [Methyloversatilis sp.]MDP3579105.1 ASCH domain-containing protein [Methyloversatilis sp.]